MVNPYYKSLRLGLKLGLIFFSKAKVRTVRRTPCKHPNNDDYSKSTSASSSRPFVSHISPNLGRLWRTFSSFIVGKSVSCLSMSGCFLLMMFALISSQNHQKWAVFVPRVLHQWELPKFSVCFQTSSSSSLSSSTNFMATCTICETVPSSIHA